MWQKAKNLYHLLVSYIAAFYFKFPAKRLIVIGVTGTDGKSTTTNMIYHILKSANLKVSMISSVNAQIGTKTYDTGFHVTTPSPYQVQRFLRKAVNSRSKYFILETTSHRLDQNIVANIEFTVGVITNITHEHLDYHKTWENYAHAKAKLFQKSKYSILNKDDTSFDLLKNAARGKIVTYSLDKKADVNRKNYKFNLKIPGEFNVYNALAAAAAAQTLGINKKQIIKSLNSFAGIKGRMEEIVLGQSFKVFIDFAHTPNALSQALRTLKSKIQNPKSKLIAVFGSAGERDQQKRPQMGKAAAESADISIITAEDPRSESVEEISKQIASGFAGKKEGKDFFKISDREEAIKKAIKIAKNGDIVATFGKSHEKSMCYGKTEHSWDEFETVKSAIKEVLKSNNAK